MKAIIMAGGEGTRLRPLTCDCPKPMVPVMDRPILEYSIELLKRHGITQIGLTLKYLPDRVMDYFGDGSAFDVDLHYYVEDAPLGTAGSVRQAQDFLDEPFLVLSGDGLTDCDLSEAFAFHKASSALATMVLKHVESPLEYGVVIADANGRVRRFAEKPGWGEVFSDTVNTGIYIFQPEALTYIPADKPYDFGREMFPSLVARELPVFAYVMDGYWCDVGDTAAYLRAHMDAMDGRIRLSMPVRAGGVLKMPGATVDRSAILEGPCYIGSGARVEEGARIGAYTVLGAGSVVERHASVKRSVLWKGARVQQEAQARGCVIQRDASLGRSASAFEESVLGDGAQIGARGTVMPGVRVWPYKQVADGMKLDKNLVWGARLEAAFDQGALVVSTPGQAVVAAQAYCAAVKPREVLLARDASPIALSLQRALSAGLMAQGVQVFEAGTATLPQARHAQRAIGAQGALWIGERSVLFLGENGIELGREARRKLEGMLARQDFDSPYAGYTCAPISLGRTDLHYIGALLSSVSVRALRKDPPKLAVFAPQEQLLSLAERAFLRAGCSVRAEWEQEMMELTEGELGFWLEQGGEQLRIADAQGALTDAQSQLLKGWCLLEGGARALVLPVGATGALEELAKGYDAEVRYVKSERAHWLRALLEESDDAFRMHTDGLYAALRILSALREGECSLREWLRQMPAIHRRSRIVPVDWAMKGRVLRAMADLSPQADLTDGVCVRGDRGWAWIRPSEERAECVVVSEGQNWEAARELCDFYTGKIQEMLEGGKDG